MTVASRRSRSFADEALSPEDLSKLEELRQAATITPDPSGTLQVSQVRTIPHVFQPRMTVVDEKHVGDLQHSLKAVGQLTPILVIAIGDHAVVIDGHHRLTAYQIEKRETIPVEFFQGTIQDAILMSGSLNSKTVMPLSTAQRTDWAWKLVRMKKPDDGANPLYSKKAIATAAAVSTSTVSTMRRALNSLGEHADRYPQWFAARDAWQDRESPWEPRTYGEVEIEERAQDLADRISKTIGTRWANNPEIMSRALIKYLGRKTPDVINELVDQCKEDPDLVSSVKCLDSVLVWGDEDEDY